MSELESSDQLLRKLCDLQQQQIEKLKELSKIVSEIAAASHTREEHKRSQSAAYAEAQGKYLDHVRQVNRGRIPVMILLGLIVVAIIVSRFL